MNPRRRTLKSPGARSFCGVRRIGGLTRRTRFSVRAKSEVAEGRAVHDGLSSGQSDLRIETLHEREIALARQARSQICQTQRAIHFGVAAARHVERELRGRLLEDCDLERRRFRSSGRAPPRRLPVSAFPATGQARRHFGGLCRGSASVESRACAPARSRRQRHVSRAQQAAPRSRGARSKAASATPFPSTQIPPSIGIARRSRAADPRRRGPLAAGFTL